MLYSGKHVQKAAATVSCAAVGRGDDAIDVPSSKIEAVDVRWVGSDTIRKKRE